MHHLSGLSNYVNYKRSTNPRNIEFKRGSSFTLKDSSFRLIENVNLTMADKESYQDRQESELQVLKVRNPKQKFHQMFSTYFHEFLSTSTNKTEYF